MSNEECKHWEILALHTAMEDTMYVCGQGGGKEGGEEKGKEGRGVGRGRREREGERTMEGVGNLHVVT